MNANGTTDSYSVTFELKLHYFESESESVNTANSDQFGTRLDVYLGGVEMQMRLVLLKLTVGRITLLFVMNLDIE